MDGRGRSHDRRQEGDESQEERIERTRREAGDEERDSADGPGYTARPTEQEPEEGSAENGG
jgi:hypothetical protein